jgi:hypothetical protein
MTIYTNSDRPNSKYAQAGFYKHVKTAKNRVSTFKTLGTGLDNEDFCKLLVCLNQTPTPQDASPVEGRDYDGPNYADGGPFMNESDDDESFNPKLIDVERDENHTLGFEDQSFLQSFKNMSINVPSGPKIPSFAPAQNHRMGASFDPAPVQTSNRMGTRGNNVKFLSPTIITYEDGRILFQCDMPAQGCTGPHNFKINIVSDGGSAPVRTKIRLLQKVPKSKYCAHSRLYGLIPRGSNPEASAQNMHFSSLETAINNKLRALNKTRQDELWETLGEIVMPFSVELQCNKIK